MIFLTATDRYIAKRIALPLLATLLVAAMLLVLEKMLRLFDFVASEGGPVSVVWQMLVNLLPEYMSLGIPIGLLLGILLAFRGLALTTEVDILRALGMGYPRLLRVPMLYASGLAALNLAIVGYAATRTMPMKGCSSNCARVRSAHRSRSANSPSSASA